jgi:cell division GTPase FtsZ
MVLSLQDGWWYRYRCCSSNCNSQKEREILTVGIVTLPFLFEGKVRQEQAKIGIEKLRKQVDSLIVIK